MKWMDVIHQAAWEYAREHGATQAEALEVAHGAEKKVRRIAEHVITQAGFTPDRWKP